MTIIVFDCYTYKSNVRDQLGQTARLSQLGKVIQLFHGKIPSWNNKTDTHAYTHVCTHTHMHRHTNTHTQTCIHTPHTHTDTNTYMYTQTHRQAHTHTHTVNIIITLDEDIELLSPHPASSHLDLESHQDGEKELVHLVQTTCCVLEDRKGQVFDDVVDALAGDRRLWGACHGKVKELQELFKGGLVHHIHHAHLHDDKVQDAATQSHWNTPKSFLLYSLQVQKNWSDITYLHFHISLWVHSKLDQSDTSVTSATQQQTKAEREKRQPQTFAKLINKITFSSCHQHVLNTDPSQFYSEISCTN